MNVNVKREIGRWIRNIALATLVVAASMAATDALADDAGGILSDVDFGVGVAWSSRYVGEGRDNLNGDGLASTTIEAAYENFSLSVWYATSPDTDYRELNIKPAYTLEWNDWKARVFYKFRRFLSDEENVNEAGVDLSFSGIPAGFAAGVEGCYSFDTEGVFFATYINRECKVADWLTLTPSALVGWNAGYAADGHDGANHCALSLEAIVPLKDGLELVGYIAQSWALDADSDKYEEDINLKDVFSGGAALCATF